MPRRPAATLKLEIGHVLFIDIVGYSKTLINQQSALVRQLNEAVRNTRQFRSAEAKGTLLCLPSGDGMALVFRDNPETPVRCAVELSKKLQARPELVVRMGIHSGPINNVIDVNEKPSITGAGINMAQRVMDCGDAGHILLSKRAADDLSEYPQWNTFLCDLGECEVKHGIRVGVFNLCTADIGNPEIPQKLRQASNRDKVAGQPNLDRNLIGSGVGVVRNRFRPLKTPPKRAVRRFVVSVVGLAVCIIAIFATRSSRPVKRSIAVLPFVDHSPARDQEYFSDGITEQITNSLGRVPGLFVPAHSSAKVFKDQQSDIRKIRQRLHVNYILEGRVDHNPNKWRIDVQLVNADNGYQVWSETYDSTEKDLLTLESDIAQKVATSLRVKLGVSKASDFSPPTNDPEGYDLYLRGRYLLSKRTTEAIQNSLSLFQQAVARDPQFALGHAGIADAYILLGEYGVMPVDDAAKEAWPEVSAALKINDRLAEAYISRAMLFGDFDWKWDAAEADYQKAIELNPNSATAHHQYSLQLAQLGRNDEALREIIAAQEHDPLSPIIMAAKAKILLVARRFQDAVAQCQRTLELEPGFGPAYSVLAQAYAFQKQYPEALEAAKKYVELSGGGDQERLELVYVQALAGQRDEARKAVEEVRRRGEGFSSYDMAAIYAVIQDKSGAFKWLEKAVRQHSIDAEWIKVDPRLDPLRGGQLFVDLSAKVIGNNPN